MRTVNHPLLPAAPGARHELVSLHYGTPGHGPKVVIQASLHADEVPGMVAHHPQPVGDAGSARPGQRGRVVPAPTRWG
jgi:hypothetical protein